MPQGDRTGPDGQGSKTGRAMGFCTGNGSPGFTRGVSRGVGFRRGAGRGLGTGLGRIFGFRGQQVELTKDQEKKILEEELAEIEAEKAEIGKQLKSLK